MILPIPFQFPNLTLSITPPPFTPSAPPRLTNILLLLHGLGDTHEPYARLATQLSLPDTAVISLRAPTPLPFELEGYHWCDDILFDSDGSLDPDAGFKRAIDVVKEVLKILVRDCGFGERNVLIWGVGQGGMLALAIGKEWNGEEASGGDNEGARVSELGGIVSLGGALPSSVSTASASTKSRTPVLVCGGASASQVPDEAVAKIRRVFEFVECGRWRRGGDGMPRSRDEMMPIMRFLGRRLRSNAGVPAGSVEVG